MHLCGCPDESESVVCSRRRAAAAPRPPSQDQTSSRFQSPSTSCRSRCSTCTSSGTAYVPPSLPFRHSASGGCFSRLLAGRRHHCPTRPTADHLAAATLALATNRRGHERRFKLEGIRIAWKTGRSGGRRRRSRVNRFGSGRKRKGRPKEGLGIQLRALQWESSPKSD